MPHTGSNLRPKRLGRRPVLDGLRGLAIALVLSLHISLTSTGFVGVDVFFVLSGFLITSLLCEERERTGSISLREFYGRRARRLLPALLALIAGFAILNFALYPFPGWPVGKRSLTTLLFVNNWIAGTSHGAGLGVLNPTWSLAQEDQFYLVWPLLLILALRSRRSPAAIVGMVVLMSVALVAAVPTVHRLYPQYSLYFSPLDRAAELLLGCAAALAWRNRLLPNFFSHRLAPWAFATALAILVFASQLKDRPTLLLAAAIAAGLVVSLLDNDDQPLARIVGARPVAYVGRISYGLYLFNLPVRNLVFHYLPHGPQLAQTLIYFGVSVALAAASWHLLESRVLAAAPRPRAAARPARGPRLEPAR